MSHKTKTLPDNENHKMKTFIVEAPEPSDGQTASSGGIRENGKLVYLYTNARPYTPLSSEETDLSIAESSGETCSAAQYIACDIIALAWKEFFAPILHTYLVQLRNDIIFKLNNHIPLCSTHRSQLDILAESGSVPEQEPESTTTNPAPSDKVIPLPIRNVS